MKNNDSDKIEQLQDNIEQITKELKKLFIEQEKLHKELKKQKQQSKAKKPYSERSDKKCPLPIGTRVRITSNHKNRKGSEAIITGYRGTTQYIVKSATVAEEEAETYSVWKANVKALA